MKSLFAYRPPQEKNEYMFFNELNETLSKAVNSYASIIVIGDLNIDVSDPDKNRNNCLSDFVDTFSQSNLINRKTCHKNLSGTTIDIDQTVFRKRVLLLLVLVILTKWLSYV